MIGCETRRGPLRRLAARYTDHPITRVARVGAYAALSILHTENHDHLANGEARVIRHIGQNARVLVDVGANHGSWALLAAAECPGATIHSFEIAPTTRAALRAAVDHVPSVCVHDVGLLDFDGTVPIKFYPGDDRVTSVVNYPHKLAYRWEHTEVTTGDSFLRSAGVDHVDLLKVDAEGADLRVLNGFDGAFSAARVTAVQFEYGYAGILTGALLAQFYRYLRSHGFMIGQVLPRRVAFRPYSLLDERFFGPNFLAVHMGRPDLIERLRGPDCLLAIGARRVVSS